MSEQGPNWSGEGQPAAAEVSERIRSILTDAEAAADALRHQAEQEAQARRRAAETESLRIVEDARREAERFLADRIARVSKLSDEILERGQRVVERLDEADAVRSELAGLVVALGETAARLANEVRSMPGPQAPEIAAPPSAPAAHREWAEPEPPVTAEPDLTDDDPEPGRTLAPDEPVAEEPVAQEPVAEEGGEEEGEALREPTPLRPEPEPEPEPATAAAEAEQPPEPTAEEIELIERVRAAERLRAGEPDGDSNGVADAPAPDVVELRADDDEPTAEAQPEPELEPEPVAAAPAPVGDQVLGARLVALQMAVAGGNRGEVEAHLRRAFELDQPGPILDDIFGSGTGADKRVAWPEAG